MKFYMKIEDEKGTFIEADNTGIRGSSREKGFQMDGDATWNELQESVKKIINKFEELDKNPKQISLPFEGFKVPKKVIFAH